MSSHNVFLVVSGRLVGYEVSFQKKSYVEFQLTKPKMDTEYLEIAYLP